MNEKTLKRFWDKVEIKEPDDCWEWTASKTEQGYGHFGFNKHVVKAHRFSWMLYSGKNIPEGMFVCHHCDNPSCVNHNHLFLGTPQDNMNDMIKKGRDNFLPGGLLSGELNGKSKLTKSQVALIRDLYGRKNEQGKRLWTQREIAKLFDTTQENISYIVRYINWR